MTAALKRNIQLLLLSKHKRKINVFEMLNVFSKIKGEPASVKSHYDTDLHFLEKFSCLISSNKD